MTAVAIATGIGFIIGGASAAIVIANMGTNVLEGLANMGYTFIYVQYFLYHVDLSDRSILKYHWGVSHDSSPFYGWFDTLFTYMYYE